MRKIVKGTKNIGFGIVNEDNFLIEGFHAIRLDYFERGGQQFLDIQWKGPGFNWRHIPSFLLYQSNEGYNKLGGEYEKRD